jgi:chromosome partitioning protein
MLKLIDEARIFRPQLVARFVLNRCAARSLIARETADALAPPLRGRIKIAAFQRGLTVADLLRALLDREFPADGGAAS